MNGTLRDEILNKYGFDKIIIIETNRSIVLDKEGSMSEEHPHIAFHYGEDEDSNTLRNSLYRCDKELKDTIITTVAKLEASIPSKYPASKLKILIIIDEAHKHQQQCTFASTNSLLMTFLQRFLPNHHICFVSATPLNEEFNNFYINDKEMELSYINIVGPKQIKRKIIQTSHRDAMEIIKNSGNDTQILALCNSKSIIRDITKQLPHQVRINCGKTLDKKIRCTDYEPCVDKSIPDKDKRVRIISTAFSEGWDFISEYPNVIMMAFSDSLCEATFLNSCEIAQFYGRLRNFHNINVEYHVTFTQGHKPSILTHKNNLIKAKKLIKETGKLDTTLNDELGYDKDIQRTLIQCGTRNYYRNGTYLGSECVDYKLFSISELLKLNKLQSNLKEYGFECESAFDNDVNYIFKRFGAWQKLCLYNHNKKQGYFNDDDDPKAFLRDIDTSKPHNRIYLDIILGIREFLPIDWHKEIKDTKLFLEKIEKQKHNKRLLNTYEWLTKATQSIPTDAGEKYRTIAIRIKKLIDKMKNGDFANLINETYGLIKKESVLKNLLKGVHIGDIIKYSQVLELINMKHKIRIHTDTHTYKFRERDFNNNYHFLVINRSGINLTLRPFRFGVKKLLEDASKLKNKTQIQYAIQWGLRCVSGRPQVKSQWVGNRNFNLLTRLKTSINKKVANWMGNVYISMDIKHCYPTFISIGLGYQPSGIQWYKGERGSDEYEKSKLEQVALFNKISKKYIRTRQDLFRLKKEFSKVFQHIKEQNERLYLDMFRWFFGKKLASGKSPHGRKCGR